MHPQYITLHHNSIDVSGQRFTRLVALGPVEKSKNGIKWLCRCDCGNTTIVTCGHLRSGHTQSCGCLYVEARKCRTTHGMSDEPLYVAWAGIIGRCTNPKNTRYHDYGGRGITICEEWRHSFELFHAYVTQLPDYGEKGYSLDRINNDSNYEPGNLRFASPTEQNRNTRKNRMITYGDETKCLAEWAQITGIDTDTIARRFQLGWTVERALFAPIR